MLYFNLRDALSALGMSVGLKVPLTVTAFHQVSGDMRVLPESRSLSIIKMRLHHLFQSKTQARQLYIYSKTQERSFTKKTTPFIKVPVFSGDFCP